MSGAKKIAGDSIVMTEAHTGVIAMPQRKKGGHSKPDINGLISDVYNTAGLFFKGMIHKPDLKDPLWARLFRVTGLYRKAYAPWAKQMHLTELARKVSGKPADMAKVMLDELGMQLGVSKSMERAQTRTLTEQASEIFDPTKLRLSDLTKGGLRVNDPDLKVEDDGVIRGREISIDHLTTIETLGSYEQNGFVKIAPNLKRLFGYYPVGTSLGSLLKDLAKIRIQTIGTSADVPQGRKLKVVDFEGGQREGHEAFKYIQSLHDPKKNLEMVNAATVQVAEDMYNHAWLTDSRTKIGDPGKRPMLVGLGLAGEIANELVNTWFQAGADVFIPDVRIESSRIAAALLTKKTAMDRLKDSGADVVESVDIFGGDIRVGQINGFDVGESIQRFKQVIGESENVFFAGMMYSAGEGREILAEVAQHFVAKALADGGLISGVVRLLSPTVVGKFRTNGSIKNDVAPFQGPSYQLAQLIKMWSTDVLKDVGITAINPIGFMTGTQGLLTEFVRKLAPLAPGFGVYLADHPDTTGSFLGLVSLAAYLVRTKQIEDPQTLWEAIQKVSFDGNVTGNKLEMAEILRKAFAQSAAPDNTLLTKMTGFKSPIAKEAYSHNKRVRGDLLDLIKQIEASSGFKDIDDIPEQILAKAVSPKDGFAPFKFQTSDGSTTYAFWVNDPSKLPVIYADRLTPQWENSLGMLFMVNPESDIVNITWHHGLANNSWSPYRTNADEKIWHALGGNMAFPSVVPHNKAEVLRDLIKQRLGYDTMLINDVDLEANATKDELANATLLGALEMVGGKGVAMTIKYALISQAYEAIGLDGVGLGGAKTITLAPFDLSSRILALEMLGTVTKKTAAYISGPDENVGHYEIKIMDRDKVRKSLVFDIRNMNTKDPEEIGALIRNCMLDILGDPDVKVSVKKLDDDRMQASLALYLPDKAVIDDESSRFHMAGAIKADERVKGLGGLTSLATARGVYQGLVSYFDELPRGEESLPKTIMVQGAGGVGSHFIDLALKDNQEIVAVADIRASALSEAKAKLDRAGKRAAYIFIEGAARDFFKHDEVQFALARREAQEKGFIIAKNLPDAIRKAKEFTGKQIGVLSPNANSHPVNNAVIDALAEAGGHAIFGGANNMLELDFAGSYKEVGRYSVQNNIFIPHDAALNMMGAATVVINAMRKGQDVESVIQKLLGVLGKRVVEEFKQAFQEGMIPQLWRDHQAKRYWNNLLDLDAATGGRFVVNDDEITSGGSSDIEGGEVTSDGDASGSGLAMAPIAMPALGVLPAVGMPLNTVF